MQFVVIARDATDSEALNRRLATREAHLTMVKEAVARGEQLFGAALLKDDGSMCGSVMVVDYPSRKEVDAWLAREPYVLSKVWEDIEVTSCKVAPSFEPFLPRKDAA